MNLDFEKEFQKIIIDYAKKVSNSVEEALTEVGNVLIDKLSNASPVGDSPNHFKDSWAMKTKYSKVRYVGNTKKNKDNIPLINLIEYGSKGKPFVLRTFDQSKSELLTLLVNKIGGKV